MKEKSIGNEIISIITAALIIPFLGVTIPIKAIEKNTLGVVMISIYYGILLVCYILKSIEYGKEESDSKETIKRIANCFKNVSLGIITIFFILQLATSFKWILFASMILLMVLEIIFDSVNIIIEYKYLFYGLTSLTMILSITNVYTGNSILMIGIPAIIIDGISNIIGPIIDNKKVLSFDIISFILFGIFLVLI